jgi:hypothetical protein
VGDDRGGPRHHVGLRDPLLDAHVGRERAELGRVAAVADRHQHRDVERGERAGGVAVHGREVRRAGRL